MQGSGGALPATARRSRTVIFANGENANESRSLQKQDIPKNVLFFIQAAGLVYHHALACISSAQEIANIIASVFNKQFGEHDDASVFLSAAERIKSELVK